ncbi:unnamed protein product [Tuber aestivum]|uniref:Uncharacterized protein n=1 Tax=Tuber aestivum TaxID=59557 RepID=A0A292PSM2_9PEZI|nr:unnamed protein product [Tuber aestivum]
MPSTIGPPPAVELIRSSYGTRTRVLRLNLSKKDANSFIRLAALPVSCSTTGTVLKSPDQSRSYFGGDPPTKKTRLQSRDIDMSKVAYPYVRYPSIAGDTS